MKADDQYHINNLWWYYMQHKPFITVHFLDKFRIFEKSTSWSWVFITLSVEANHCKISDANAKCFLWDNLVGQNSLCSTYWTQWSTYLSWLFYIRLCILVVHVWMCTYYKNGLQNSSQWHDTWKGVISLPRRRETSNFLLLSPS